MLAQSRNSSSRIWIGLFLVFQVLLALSACRDQLNESGEAAVDRNVVGLIAETLQTLQERNVKLPYFEGAGDLILTTDVQFVADMYPKYLSTTGSLKHALGRHNANGGLISRDGKPFYVLIDNDGDGWVTTKSEHIRITKRIMVVTEKDFLLLKTRSANP
jgi:hypothetical protein